MEALLSSGSPETDVLVGNLKYGLDPQGSYITQRRQATGFSNVNSASATGVKTITFNIGSASEWLDPASFLVSFNIQNTHGSNDLFPASPDVSCLFSRLQIRMGATLVEDIQEFGKLTIAMEEHSMGPQKKLDYAQLGFGTIDPPTSDVSHFGPDQHEAPTIAAGATKRVHMKFHLSGLLNQNRWIFVGCLGGARVAIAAYPLRPYSILDCFEPGHYVFHRLHPNRH